ncbi:GAF1, partial [Symbiodinium microadriaticum]
MDVAVARGICFEIQYSPVLTAPASRRQVISTTRVLVQYLKGKGVILTSGAEALGHMRGPVDVLYLAELLGIPRHHARMTVSENCALVLKHAAARRLRYAPVELIGMTEFYR